MALKLICGLLGKYPSRCFSQKNLFIYYHYAACFVVVSTLDDRCILGELWSRTAMFNANSEPHQLELIFSILGCPPAPLLAKFRELPDWEKCGFQNFHYTSRLSQSAHSHKMDPAAFRLMQALLEMDPEQRLRASHALEHEYFTQGSPVRSPEE